ncbi:MAG: hypothetical protein AABZ39_08575 [Spirochaetota bacterium]
MSRFESYLRDLTATRLSIIAGVLKTPKVNTRRLGKFPELLYAAKKGALSDGVLEEYKAAYLEYRNVLNELRAAAIADMCIKHTRLDLSTLFRFIIGGNIRSGKFIDHVTNRCFSNLMGTLCMNGSAKNNVCYENAVSEKTMLSENDFTEISVKRSEEEYLSERTAPHFLYLLLAFIFNTAIMEESYEIYLNEKEVENKKFYIFADMFDDRSNIVTLCLDRTSVFSDIFFRIYLDELTRHLKGTIDKVGKSDIRLTERNRLVLHDPSPRR